MTGISWRVRTDSRAPSPPRLLIVDDDPMIRWWLHKSLGARGYQITEAQDGRAAMAALEDGASPPAFVLLDYQVPDSAELGLLSKILKRAPNTRVILMSAYTLSHATASAAGAFAILEKPFEIRELIDVLEGPSARSASTH